MRRLSREEREATGATSLRVTKETRGLLVMLLNRRFRGTREHQRGGRQYGARASATIDDVVYDLALEALTAEPHTARTHPHATRP